MPDISVRCFAEMNDHLPAEKRGKPFSLRLDAGTSVSGILALLSIPQSEVDLVLLNGASVSFDDVPAEGDHLSIFPVFESFDINSVQKLRENALRSPRFLLDVHLGHLARYLRMLGFDTMYEPGFEDVELASISLHEHRTLLTRDRALAADPALTHVYQIVSEEPREQLREVVERFDLLGSIEPFCRCLVCNAILRPVEKEAVIDQLPPRVREEFAEFQQCPACRRIFWKGSHYKRMVELVRRLQSSA